VPRLWSCEDEDEAHGLAVVLERAGILVELREQAGAVAIDVPERDEPRARALLGRIAAVHARRIDDGRDRVRMVREKVFARIAGIATAIALVVLLAILLR